jgi:hypothetical protein
MGVAVESFRRRPGFDTAVSSCRAPVRSLHHTADSPMTLGLRVLLLVLLVLLCCCSHGSGLPLSPCPCCISAAVRRPPSVTTTALETGRFTAESAAGHHGHGGYGGMVDVVNAVDMMALIGLPQLDR